MSRAEFDYGAEVLDAGQSFKQSEEGSLTGRVRSIIHLGVWEKPWKGKRNPACSYVAVLMELYDQFEEDGETPLSTSICIPLKKGSPKASLTKFLKAVDPKKEAEGFTDIIGNLIQLDMVGGKEKLENGDSKYVNCGGYGTVPSMIEKICKTEYPELIQEGVGHVLYADMSVEAMKELHPALHINAVLEDGVSFSGSKAEEVLKKIRETEPDFAKASKKEKTDEDSADDVPTPSDLDENKEY